MSGETSVAVREAVPADLAELTAVLDAAMLQTDREHIRKQVRAGAVLVACRDGGDTILGTLVLDGAEITAVAVRPRRRGQGIGRTLVDAAAERRERLVAVFDPRVREFWASLGFEIEQVAESDRLRPESDCLRSESDRLRGSLEGRPDGGLAGGE